MARKTKQQRLKTIFPHLLSILTATLLWFFVININHIERSVSITIVIHNLSPSLTLTSISSREAVVRLRGNREILDERFISSLRPVIDLKNAVPGTNAYPLTIEKPYIPANVSIVAVKPKTVTIGLVHTSKTNKEPE